jgi:conjugative relaxase-like TrwC/TraI family protein
MMSTHKLTAGDGYLYLIRQTAAADGTDKGRPSLSDYYSDKGESPGRWVGLGVPALATPTGRMLITDAAHDLWRVTAGSAVTEDQMKALFGLGLHPNTAALVKHLITQGVPKAAALEAAKLGRPFHINPGDTELQRRLAVAYRDHNLSQGEQWNAPIDDDMRARMRTTIAWEMFVGEYAREPADDRELSGFIARNSRELTTSVAGYDLTFTPVKSVSTLWALAPLDVSRVVEECHDRAVADALEYLQDHAAFTRTGAAGVAQIDTEGFIAALFTHRDSRAGDPGLHSHVAISNKVRATGADGIPRWLALDGRPLFKSTVAASELYNTRIEGYLMQRLSVAFAERVDTERGKRPVREILGIPADLNELLSSRRAAIGHRTAELMKQFQADHGREPTTPEAIALAQQATLATRPAKHEPRSVAEQRQQWRAQAIQHLGGHAALTGVLGRALSARRQRRPQITAQWIHEQAAAVIQTVAQARSIWQRTHVFAEAQRRVRAAGLATDHRVADAITDTALQDPFSIAHARVGDTDLGEPAMLRRRDGSSVYSTHGTEVYTNGAILAAEKRIIAAATRVDGRRAADTDVDLALLEQLAKGRELNAGQQALVRTMACSGARVSLALAPAGTGKTTAMATLARAWKDSGGGVVGLSPSANAAQILRADIDTDTDTVDKFLWLQGHPDAVHDPARAWLDAIDASTLIIIDEAGKAGTLALDAVITEALRRGASVRLIGDDKQLSAIAAGGVLRDIEALTDSLTLTEVMRFTSRGEAAATLALRNGDSAAIAFYADHHRIHVGADATASDMAFHRWRQDRARGYDSLLLAPTNEAVAELNGRARLDRLTESVAAHMARTGTAGAQAETRLSDGLHASAGDIIATRCNKRSLRIGGAEDFVRNGYRWSVENVRRDGALTVSHLTTHRRVTLPASYVRQYVTLGYACTIDASQGMTVGNKTCVGTCHVVGADTLSRQQLYTALSRGTDETHIYLSTAEADPHRILTPKATHPDTAVDVLTRALARDDAEVSATTEQRNAEDPFLRLGAAAAAYLDAVGEAAQRRMHGDMLRLDIHAEDLHPGLTRSAGWPVLRQHLAIIAANGQDAAARLAAVADKGSLADAVDPAAVLDWQLDSFWAHSGDVGPLRWLPAIPPCLKGDTELGDYLTAREQLVTELAGPIRTTAAAWTAATAPRWALPLVAANPRLAAEIAVFRAAFNVPDADTRLTGPQQYPAGARAIQQILDGRAATLLGRPGADTGRWHDVIDAVDPRIRRDPYWPQLAAQLSTIGRTGVDLRQLLSDAADQGPLPDEMPGAALWWRLSGTLSPATLETSTAHLWPPWLSVLPTVFGTALAEAIAGDPAFPGLVAAVSAADPTRWTPTDLLYVSFEHLRDVDYHRGLRPDEYARLLTYAVDLYTTEHPFDHDIPVPTEPPLTPDEYEELRHRYPDPQYPGLDDETLLEMPGSAGDLSAPDPLGDACDIDDELRGLAFEDLLTERPARRPLGPTLDNVAALRTDYQHATDDVADLARDIQDGWGPAVRAAMPQIRELRARADADRPYLIAVHDVIERWAQAQEDCDHALHDVQWARQQLTAIETDPDADPLDVASARLGVQVALMLIPQTTPAQRFHCELATATTQRAQAAGGADNIVTSDDVDALRLRADDVDRATLNAARARRNQIRADLQRAEAASAAAFAEAKTRNADYFLKHANTLRAALPVLRASGGYQTQRRIALPTTATDHLPALTARAVTALGASGFTVIPVHAGDDRTAVDALSVLHAAAATQDRKVLWCSPTAWLADRARTADVADTVADVDDTHRRLRDGSWQLPPGAILVLDHAAAVDPATIADLAEHAVRRQASLLLVDPGDHRWPYPPSASLLTLLHEDLPWSLTLSVADATPARPTPQPDLDPMLDRVARYDPDLLPPGVTDALTERRRLREEHASAYRVHTALWRVTSKEATRGTDSGLDRQA